MQFMLKGRSKDSNSNESQAHSDRFSMLSNPNESDLIRENNDIMDWKVCLDSFGLNTSS